MSFPVIKCMVVICVMEALSPLIHLSRDFYSDFSEVFVHRFSSDSWPRYKGVPFYGFYSCRFQLCFVMFGSMLFTLFCFYLGTVARWYIPYSHVGIFFLCVICCIFCVPGGDIFQGTYAPVIIELS